MDSKTLKNTDQDAARKNVSDIAIFGEDLFKLLSKASSKKQGWMKSTKAMEIEGVGCVVQVTTQQLNDTAFHTITYDEKGMAIPIDFANAETIKHSVIAEAVTTVPGAKIQEQKNEDGEVIGRKLVAIT